MNFKTTIGLIVVLAIAGTAYWLTKDQPAPDGASAVRLADSERVGVALFSADELPTESVQRLTIRRGDTTVVLAQVDGQWRQVEPVDFPLSEWRAREVVDKAATLRYVDRFEPGKGGNPTLADVGLETPAAVVTVEIPAEDDRPARTQTIRFGRSVGSQAYAMINDDARVYAVNADAHRTFVREEPTAWRSRSITAPGEGAATAITLRRDGEAIGLTKQDGRWMLASAPGDRADTDAVKGLLSAIGSLSISEFVDADVDDIALYGLDSPRITLSVQDADGTFTLSIGRATDLTEDRFYATWTRGADTQTQAAPPPVVFTINKAGVERFNKSLKELRDPRLTIARATEVNEITLQRRDQPTIHVQKTPEGWTFADPGPGFEADGAAVGETLDAIIDARSTQYVPDAAPEGEPVATVTLNLIGGKAPERLGVWSQPEDRLLVLRDGETTGYVVPRDRLAKLFQPVVALRDRDLFDLSADDVEAITVQRDDGTFLLRRHRTPAAEEGAPATVGDWQLEGDHALEKGTAEALVEALADLRAELWLAPEDVGGSLRLIVKPFDGEPIDLRIDPQTRLAAGPWSEGVAVLPQSLIDAATAEFRYRTVLPIKVADLASVTLRRGEASVTIQRDASGRYVRAGGGEIDAAAAAAVFDELAGLGATRYRDLSTIQVDADNPTTTLTLQLTDGTTRTLALWPPSANDLRAHLGRLDDASLAFTLETDAVERLVRPLETPADDK